MTSLIEATAQTKQARAPELTTLSHTLALEKLQTDKPNGISPNHSLALWQMMSAFTAQGLQINRGRYAYALPCGAGKTTGVVAWIVAQHRLGLNISVAVSSQQIEALCSIKSSLIDAGVPEHFIGIRHSKGSSVIFPDTGTSDRLIMLGSHCRIRGASENPEFCHYRGNPRDLLIWDESLISADATVLDLQYTVTALTHWARGGARPLLQAILTRLSFDVDVEKASQASQGAPRILTLITDAECEAALAELGRPYCREPGEESLFVRAKQALKLMSCPVTLLNVGNGSDSVGLMRYQIMIAPEFENIAVLDASYVVRALCKADRTILNGSTTAMLEFKSYSKVLVKHTPEPSGRCKFNGSRASRARAVQAAVNSIAGIPEDEPVLIFTYKQMGASTIIGSIKAELRERGVNPETLLSSGQPRITFNTWGRHTTDNSFRHCKHVVLLGVLRVPKLQLGAAFAGQKDDLAFRLPNVELQAVEHTELASNVLQAANRGCCREVDENGEAHPMTIHLVTKEKQLKPLLESAMPNLQWETVGVPVKLDESLLSLTVKASQKIQDYLRGLPPEQHKVSIKAVYSATEIELKKDSKAEALEMALVVLSVSAKSQKRHYWIRESLSLIRQVN